MIIYSMTRSMVVPLHVYFIWTKKLQWVGILQSILLLIQPHMVLVLFLLVPVWSGLFICRIPFHTLLFPFTIKSTCLDIINLFLKYPSAINLHANLHKCHTELHFYILCESVASNIVDLCHIYRGYNPYGILSKHWIYSNIWGLFQSLLFWMGYVMDLLDLELREGCGWSKREWYKSVSINRF